MSLPLLQGRSSFRSGLHPHDLIYCNHPLKGSMSSTASRGLGLLRTNVAIVGGGTETQFSPNHGSREQREH